MYIIEETGGANIGYAQATWPFAKLLVNKNELQLTASIIGNVYFRPSDIISIEPSSLFSGAGIKINHRVKEYSAKVIFLTSGSRDLIKRIESTGFLNNLEPIPIEVEAKILKYQSSGSFPMKWSAVITFGIIWNLLFLGDQLRLFGHSDNKIPFAIGAQLALAFAFLFALAILISKPFSQLILKESRTTGEVKSFLLFLMAITGFMFTMISFILH